jgi:hypothetical protein
VPAGGLGREADDSAGRPRAPRCLLVRVALTEGLSFAVCQTKCNTFNRQRRVAWWTYGQAQRQPAHMPTRRDDHRSVDFELKVVVQQGLVSVQGVLHFKVDFRFPPRGNDGTMCTGTRRGTQHANEY